MGLGVWSDFGFPLRRAVCAFGRHRVALGRPQRHVAEGTGASKRYSFLRVALTPFQQCGGRTAD